MYSLRLAWRLAGASKGSLSAFLSRTSVAGLALGVALLITVLSVMNGFDREMRTRILGLLPHVSLSPQVRDLDWRIAAEQAREHPGVRGVAPYLPLQGMLVNGEAVRGAMLYGIDPTLEEEASRLSEFVPTAALRALAEEGALVPGRALAESLGLVPGQRVTVVVPRQDADGNPSPQISRLVVAGWLDSGTELDQRLALLHLDRARELAGEDAPVSLRVRLDNLFAAPRLGWELNAQVYGYRAQDWTRSHGNLYSAIQLSKRLVGLMLGIIVAVAAFNLVSALVMVVNDKQGEIAILRSQGATPGGIVLTFLIQGLLVGALGTALGVALGVLLSLLITDLVAALETLLSIRFLESDVYPVSYLPADLRFEDVLTVALLALGLSALAALYPAWRAARVAPAEALRYE